MSPLATITPSASPRISSNLFTKEKTIFFTSVNKYSNSKGQEEKGKQRSRLGSVTFRAKEIKKEPKGK